MRIGQGFDVHKFGGEGPIMLAGVEVPSERGLVAHSDGDVALHALCDAILGAVGEGDIGTWFPDDDPQFKGADSGVLLQKVYQLALNRGLEVINLDLTIIAQVPRIGPYRGKMAKRVSELLGLPDDRVNIKATTTETLGFTGRKEGIAAMAIVLLGPQHG